MANTEAGRNLRFDEIVSGPRLGVTSDDGRAYTEQEVNDVTNGLSAYAYRGVLREDRPAVPALVAMFRRSGVSPIRTLHPLDTAASGPFDDQCPSETHLLHARDTLRDVVTGLSTATPGSLEALGRDEIRKWVPERGRPAGWAVPPRVAPRSVGAIDKRVWFHLRSLAVRDDGLATSPWPVKMGTNKGAPFWSTDDQDHLFHMALASACPDADKMCEAFTWMYKRLGLGSTLGDRPAMTALMRTGPLRKPARIWGYRGSSLAPIGEVTGVFCRCRVVRAYPTAPNEVSRGYVMAATKQIKTGPLAGIFYHTTPEQVAAKAYTLNARGLTPLSDDISNFDDTADLSHLNALYDNVYAHWMPASVLSVLRLSTHARLISTPLHSDDIYASYDQIGGIKSGVINTTLDGTLINFACVLQCYAEATGQTIDQAWAGLIAGAWGVFVQGDDTLMFVPASFDGDAYLACAQRLGFKRAFDGFPVFLKRWIDVRAKRTHTLASRALMRSYSAEHPAAGPASTLLSANVRWDGCRLDPTRDRFFRAALDNAVFQQYGIKNPDDLSRIARLPETIAAAERETRVHRSRDWGRLVESLLGYTGAFQDDGTLTPAAELLLQRFGGLASWSAGIESNISLIRRAAAMDWRTYFEARLADITDDSRIGDLAFGEDPRDR